MSHELKKKIDGEFRKDNTSYDDMKYHESTTSKLNDSKDFSQTYQSSQYKRAFSRENFDAKYLAAAETTERINQNSSRRDNYYSLFNNRDYPKDLPK